MIFIVNSSLTVLILSSIILTTHLYKPFDKTSYILLLMSIETMLQFEFLKVLRSTVDGAQEFGIIEENRELLKVAYLILMIYVTLSSFALIKISFVAFLAKLIIGNLMLRIVFELTLIMIELASDVKAIRKKK